MSIEAMKQARNAFVWNLNTDLDNIPACDAWAKMLRKNIDALDQAIQEEALRNVQRLGQEIEQEPDDLTVAYMSGLHDGKKQRQQEPCPFVVSTKEGTHYCSLSQRQPLTDEEIDTLLLKHGVMNQWPTQKQVHAFARAIEAAHNIFGEKK